MPAVLPLRHLLLALAMVVVWGTNFVVIKLALGVFPPLTFAALRFALAFLPAPFLFRLPKVRLRELAAYGLLIGVGQFGFLYLAMSRYISPGLAALVAQTQVFFTIGLAILIRGEALRRFQYVAIGLAALGILLILANVDAQTTPLGLVLTLLAALSWSVGNIVAARSPGVDVLAYVSWSSAFAIIPLFALAAIFEGVPAIAASFVNADLWDWAAVVWQSAGNTLFGFAVLAWLLARYPAGTIMPLILLVPVVGLLSSALLLGEALPAWKILAAALVLAGLLLDLLWPRLSAARRAG